MLDPHHSGKKGKPAFGTATVSAAFKGCEGLAQDENIKRIFGSRIAARRI
jgi:hypothetical protein